MRFPEKTVTLRDGRTVTLRSPEGSDAAEMIRYMKTVNSETEFLIRSADESDIPEADERAFLCRTADSSNDLMITAFSGERVVGNCQIGFHDRKKTRHRAGIAIAIVSDFWGCGLGTALMKELIAAAIGHGVSQIELGFIEGNDRAKRLYENLGFQIYGEVPDAYRLEDGSSRKEYLMRLCL